MGLALRMVGFTGLALLLAACASGPAHVPPPAAISSSSVPQAASAAASEDAYSRAILQAVNAERAGRGIAPLSFSGPLQRAAAIHSADMAARGFVGDFNPDAQGPDERVKAVWPDFKGTVGENISVNEGILASESSTTPDVLAAAIITRWTGALQMRKNVRNTAFTLGGIGITRSGDKIFVTGVFAAP